MEQALNPASLPSGTHVGPWRLGHLLGRGTFGTVYFAQGTAPAASGPAALKLAHAPHDERFAREVALLSRLHHPCIPRLLGHGHWQSPSGQRYPYLAMERVEGVPLYEWAQSTPPTSRQLLRLLAGLARALEAVHSAGGVHRDVKGGNVLVRSSDGHGFLVDFGSCHFVGASTLTFQAFPPGTPPYRSPEAFGHVRQLLGARAPFVPYAPGPSDDIFALGVTAWRLVTGDYPPTPDPGEPDAFWDWQQGGGPRLPHEFDARCGPALSGLISRMLCVRMEARGSAGELAAALEAAAHAEGLAAAPPRYSHPVEWSADSEDVPSAPSPQGELRRGSSRRTAVSLSLAASLAALGLLTWQEWRASRSDHTTEEEGDGGTVGLGDELLTAPVSPEHAPPGWSTIGLDVPSRPFLGQVRADANGRCPSRMYVAINGGCWRKAEEDSPGKCAAYDYRYKGACYVPIYHPPRPPTSSPTDAPDGGAR